MVEFDEEGFYILGSEKRTIKHERGYVEQFSKDNPTPLSKKVNSIKWEKFVYDKKKYKIYSHVNRKHVDNKTLKTVPLYTTTYSGFKHEHCNYEGSGALVVIGQSLKSDKKLIVYFLIPY